MWQIVVPTRSDCVSQEGFEPETSQMQANYTTTASYRFQVGPEFSSTVTTGSVLNE